MYHIFQECMDIFARREYRYKRHYISHTKRTNTKAISFPSYLEWQFCHWSSWNVFPSELDCSWNMLSEMGTSISSPRISLDIINNNMYIHCHNSDVIMNSMTYQIIGVSIVYSTVCSGVDQGKTSSVPLAFVRGIQRWPADSPHKGSVTRNMLPFDDVITLEVWNIFFQVSLAVNDIVWFFSPDHVIRNLVAPFWSHCFRLVPLPVVIGQTFMSKT